MQHDVSMDITILLFNEVDLLDAGGPYEVFLTASRLVQRDGGEAPFRVSTASLDGQPVEAFGGLGLIPERRIEEVLKQLENSPESAHVLVVPGTIDIEKALTNDKLLEAIRRYASPSATPSGATPDSNATTASLTDVAAESASDPDTRLSTDNASQRIIASVCTGAFLLAETGLLSERGWTTHWEDVDLLSERLGPEGAQRDVRWVDSGPVITSGGLSAGIDMALHLVHRFAGLDLATRTATQIDYTWEPDGGQTTKG